MAIGEGWWISPNGKVYSVLEHLSFIKENPGLFGFSEKESKFWTEKDRDRVLIKVMKQGWVRVRDFGGGRGISVETWALTPVVRRNILDFLINYLGFMPTTRFQLSLLGEKFYKMVDLESLERGRLYLIAKKVSRKRVLKPLMEGEVYNFVIHDHYAQQHHWDLRLEWPIQQGVDINKELEEDWRGKNIYDEYRKTKNKKFILRSFAIPKHKLPEKINQRLMMSETELHPVEYGSFEGEIEKGLYGAGEVKILDKGKYTVLQYDSNRDILVIYLQGKKINGVFSLVPAFKEKNQWLIIRLDKREWLGGKKAMVEPLSLTLGFQLQELQIKALKKDWTEDELKKLDEKELSFDHALTHRGVNLINNGEEFGEWKLEELYELHDAIVNEAKRRGLKWGTDHNTPIKEESK